MATPDLDLVKNTCKTKTTLHVYTHYSSKLFYDNLNQNLGMITFMYGFPKVKSDSNVHTKEKQPYMCTH